MTVLDKYERYTYIYKLISKKATGSPKQLASKLGVCERTIYRLIKELKVYGYEIEFCYLSNSYILSSNDDNLNLGK